MGEGWGEGEARAVLAARFAGGHLPRPTDRDAADLVREIATRPRHPRYLIIYKESAAEFELLLQEAGLSYTRLPAPGGYALLILPGGASPP